MWIDQKGKQRKRITFTENNKNCFECTSHAGDKRGGYPIIKFGSKRIRISRLIYTECFGEIPAGHVVRHKCDNPACINPEHLEIGTHAQNMQDMKERGRAVSGMVSGERHGMAKITKVQAEELRSRAEAGESRKLLAAAYGISESNVYRVINRELWK